MIAPGGSASGAGTTAAHDEARAELSADDIAIDHALAQIDASFRFILDVTPTNAADERRAFLAGDRREPVFEYRDLDVDPAVLLAELDRIELDLVEDATLGHLVRAKHRELTLQAGMLQARGTSDFRHLSTEAYGAVSPDLIAAAEGVLREVSPAGDATDRLDAESFHELAEREIEHYTSIAPDAQTHADIREGIQGVVVSDDSLLIGPDTRVDASRAMALIHHEVGTHLVTRVNGIAQPLRLLGAGFAGYDEAQEGLAVLAEIACGELTAGRLRQLAARVVAVRLLLDGTPFPDAVAALVEAGTPEGAAFTTTMRVHRAGGFTKDAVYLRGLVGLLQHLASGGSLDRFWLGKFALDDLPLVDDLAERGVLAPAILTPRYLDDPDAAGRLQAAAATVDDLPGLLATA